MTEHTETTEDRYCEICEHFAGCRGECTGTDDGSPCSGFRRAEDRHGDCCPQTGDLIDLPY